MIVDVEDKLFTNLAIVGAMREASYIFRDLNSANSAIQSLVGRSEPDRNVSLTFSEIAEIVCSDDVLNRAIDLLKEMSQNSWRPSRNSNRDQQRNLHRENYIQRSRNDGE